MPISVSVLVLAADAVANFIFMIPVFSSGTVAGKGIAMGFGIWYDVDVGNHGAMAALPSLRRGDPPDERKEGDADECYIFGFIPILYLHRCPDKFVLCNLSGQKIAATTAIVTADRF